MLKKLKLTNFRQHADRTFDFTDGLNTLRGANESGKSTVIEAVLYALYGSKALRDSLSDCVTWGHKETALKVELVIEVNGCEYSYSRSKAGAEVCVNGKIFTTGQNEVTAHSASILGADAKTASSLMLADQSGLRGALDDGPTAVSGLMGKLADFNLIDRIVEEMQAKLLLGADAPIREKLRLAEIEMGTAQDELPNPARLEQTKSDAAAAEKKLEKLEKQRADVEAVAYNDAMQKLTAAEASAKEYDTAVAAVDVAQERLGKAITALDDAKVKVVAVDQSRIEALRKAVFDLGEAAKVRRAHQTFLNLPDYPELYWEGGWGAFEAELNAQNERLTECKVGIESINAHIVRLQSSKVVGGVCRTCGTDVSQRPDIIEKNAAVDEEVALKTKQMDVLKRQLTGLRQLVSQLEAIMKVDREWDTATRDIRNYITFDPNFVPPRLTWNGGDVVEVSGDDLKAELAKLEQDAAASKRAEGAVEALTKALEQAKVDCDAAQMALKKVQKVDVAPFEAAFNVASEALRKIDDAIFVQEGKVKLHKSELAELESLVDRCTARYNAAASRVAEYKTDIEQLGFNNSLLKKMRAIKPSVTDHLWNTVLAAVSQFFTQMRGESSVVTKDGDGFKVNGSTVKSLSGSTLDVLALAVRVALTKTFVPHTSLLVLDEPAYGCDSTRTASLLGFLSSVGFRQVVLASHDELSEAVSDNVISLG